jgi:plasmid stabilization system protein ParE
MPKKLLAFHPEAVEEATAAAQWYRERDPAIADAFVAELDRAMDRIIESPVTWPKYLADTRRYLLRRFPFSVVYRETPEVIQILAVAHARRKPGYWKGR